MGDPFMAKQMIDRLRDELGEMLIPAAGGGTIRLLDIFEYALNAMEVSVDHWAEAMLRDAATYAVNAGR